DRYAVADPMRHVPLAIPALLVHGVLDETVSVSLSRDYARAALAAGADVRLVEIEGEAGRHRAHVDPREASWEVVVRWLEQPTGPSAANGALAVERSGRGAAILGAEGARELDE